MPVVSLATISSTLSEAYNEDCDNSWYKRFLEEQPDLSNFIDYVKSTIPGDMDREMAYAIGAITMYRMLTRQIEADKLNQEIT